MYIGEHYCEVFKSLHLWGCLRFLDSELIKQHKKTQ